MKQRLTNRVLATLTDELIAISCYKVSLVLLPLIWFGVQVTLTFGLTFKLIRTVSVFLSVERETRQKKKEINCSLLLSVAPVNLFFQCSSFILINARSHSRI